MKQRGVISEENEYQINNEHVNKTGDNIVNSELREILKQSIGALKELFRGLVDVSLVSVKRKEEERRK